jgi:hypothetical protein
MGLERGREYEDSVLFGSRGGTRPWMTRKEPVVLLLVSLSG